MSAADLRSQLQSADRRLGVARAGLESTVRVLLKHSGAFPQRAELERRMEAIDALGREVAELAARYAAAARAEEAKGLAREAVKRWRERTQEVAP